MFYLVPSDVYPVPAGWPQHAVRASEFIPVQKWNSPQGGKVHYTDVDGATNDRWRSSALWFAVLYILHI